jgi:DNA repair photolyase
MSSFATIPLSALKIKGRGALSNPAGRFVGLLRDSSNPSLDATAELIERRPKTSVSAEFARSIISRNQSPDIPFELSINPYRGCEHGCFYCYARPNHSYSDLSPGLDFETRLSAKLNTVELLRKELAAPNYQSSPINLGAATDCYQPIEREYRLTRGILETLLAVRHPVTIVTKSSLVERDLDLLVPLAQQNLVQVFLSVTSLDGKLSQLMEPRAAAPHSRIKTVKRLSNAGIPVGVLVAPIIPFINEPEIEAIVDQAALAGARSVHYTVLRMPCEVAELSKTWLETHFPDRADRVLRRVQEMRGGKDNDPRFGSRMKGQGVWAQLIKARMHAAARRNLLQNKRISLDSSLFSPDPLRRSFEPMIQTEQMELFS